MGRSRESAGGDGRPSAPRRFTVVDAMILVAAVGFALIPMRDIYERVAYTLLPIDSDDWRSPYFYWNWAGGLAVILRPLAVTTSAALWLARLRRPRPSIRRVFRQPGTAAATAVLASFVLGIVQRGAELIPDLLEGKGFEDWEVWFAFLWMLEELFLGKAVLAVWVVLWLGRAGRAEKLDRSRGEGPGLVLPRGIRPVRPDHVLRPGGTAGRRARRRPCLPARRPGRYGAGSVGVRLESLTYDGPIGRRSGFPA